MASVPAEREQPQQQPLRRTAKRRKVTQRPNITNDVVELYSRRVNELSVLKDSVPTMQQDLDEAVRAWNAQKNEYEAMTSATGDGDVGAAEALYTSLETTKQELVQQGKYLKSLASGQTLHDYLLSAIPYLNTHHALTADIIALRKGQSEAPASDGGATTATSIQSLTVQLHANSHEYTSKYHTDLVRDSDKQFRAVTGGDVCNDCGGEVIESENSYIVCSGCGVVQHVGFSYDATNNLNWADLRNAPGRQYTYRRLNHFREYLRQIQGRSRTTIPVELLTDLHAEFQKARIPTSDINPARVKRMLKKLNRSKFYEHSVTISIQLSPEYKPLVIHPAHEEKMCLMFCQLEKPFDKLKHIVKRGRKNFLSYPFVYFKLNELNSWDEYNLNCTLLKSVSLINKQDKWWTLVMKELGWEVVGRTFDT